MVTRVSWFHVVPTKLYLRSVWQKFTFFFPKMFFFYINETLITCYFPYVTSRISFPLEGNSLLSFSKVINRCLRFDSFNLSTDSKKYVRKISPFSRGGAAFSRD